MNLPTIEIPVEEAKARLAEYEAAVRQERNAEDEAIAAAYRAAARGLPVVRLSEAVAAGGWFDDGLPRIAVVRADAKQCWAQVSPSLRGRQDSIIFADSRNVDNRGALVGERTVLVSVPSFTGRRTAWRARTTVPIVPPRHRPGNGRLRHCHVLWEVESWTPEPPRDPALLRHIRGDLWAVLATWDLSPLERAVLGARATS